MRYSNAAHGIVESEEEANELAKALVKKLQKEVGGVWEANVWHNLWWCYCAKLIGGSISMREEWDKNEGARYRLTFSDTIGDHSSTLGVWNIKNAFNTPTEALKAHIDKAEEYVNRLNRVVDHNKDLINLN